MVNKIIGLRQCTVTRFAKVTIYFECAFIVTVFDIFKLIIDYQVDRQIDDRPFKTLTM